MLSKGKRRQILLCSLSPLLITATALAQAMPGGSMQQPMQQPNLPGQQQPMPNLGIPPNASSPDPRVLYEQGFAAKALQSDAAAVQLGQLAQQKSQSDDVKQVGNQIAQDDTQLKEKLLEPVAKQLGVKEPEGLPKKDKELVAKLESLSGPQFDEECIKAMAKDQKQDLKEYKTEAETATDENVQLAAKEGSKLAAQHLELIQQVAQNHNVTLDAK
jgi:putative membrane protein